MDTATERKNKTYGNTEVYNKHTGTFKLMGLWILTTNLYNKLVPNKPDKITKNILNRC